MIKTRLILLALCVALAACTNSPATSLPPTPASEFQDDFTKDNGLWQIFTEPNASAKIADGNLSLIVSAPFTVSFSVAAINLSNFDLTVVTAQTSPGTANGYGVIFRYIDNQNFYRFDIGGDGKWAVSRRFREQWIHLSELKASAVIKVGVASNTLRVVARGDKFEFYANNTLLGNLNDPTLPVGRVGVFASTFDDAKTEVKFDNLKVTKP